MRELPVPPHFNPDAVGVVWPVPYEERARDARSWAEAHVLAPAASDSPRVCLLAVDVQNTFCIPGFELFVAARSGSSQPRLRRISIALPFRYRPSIWASQD